MQRLPFRARAGRAALAAASLMMVLCVGSPAALAEDPALLVRLPDPVASWVVYRSLVGAIDRLERSASCRSVLDDFTTASGEPLSVVVEARGESPGRYLAGLLFLDGTAHARCRSGGVAAFTAPGWRVVYVCSAVFRERLQHHSAEAEAALIHEALHTLGLGENPPTPRAIQDRVRARCVTPGRTIASAR
jgi:hypothetical protein